MNGKFPYHCEKIICAELKAKNQHYNVSLIGRGLDWNRRSDHNQAPCDPNVEELKEAMEHVKEKAQHTAA